MKFTTIILILSFINFASEDSWKIGFYKYCDGYTFKYIDICKDHSYTYLFRSCNGSITSKGTWTSKGDTIFLQGQLEETTDTLRIVKDTLFERLDNKFTNFQPFTKKTKKNTVDKRDCCKECYERSKGNYR